MFLLYFSLEFMDIGMFVVQVSILILFLVAIQKAFKNKWITFVAFIVAMFFIMNM